MTALKIGACLFSEEIAHHRDWLFDSDRDIELQDFFEPPALSTEYEARIEAARAALDGHAGRVGIHGPFEGLNIDNRDPEIQPIITARYVKAVEAADRIGARQVVLHSPYDLWYQHNDANSPKYTRHQLDGIHCVLDPVVRAAETAGVTLVLENIQDVRPETRRELVEGFASDSLALSIDTGHAHIARRVSGAPPVDYFVRDAGDRLAHVHLQDVDGYADRHWAPGEGEIEWEAVFRALRDCRSAPHLLLELKDKADIPKGFAYLKGLGLVE